MTIDERLDKLTERHEALSQTVELLTADVRSLAGSIGTLKDIAVTALESIQSLERIATAHEHRISKLEDRK